MHEGIDCVVYGRRGRFVVFLFCSLAILMNVYSRNSETAVLRHRRCRAVISLKRLLRCI